MVGFLTLIGVAPASAHGVEGVESSNYQTRLQKIAPEVRGVSVRVIEGGSRFEVRNETSEDVLVLGYEGEPYLRVGRSGVFNNTKSPATYLNASRYATRAVPEAADADAEPEWEKVSDDNVARWHDHRAHWMGKEDPPEVRRAPDRTHVLYDEWEVPLEYGGRSIIASGDLRWIPPPNSASYWGLATLMLVLTVGSAFAEWFRLPAILAASLLVLDIVHVLGVAGSKEGSLPTKVGELAIGSFVSVTAWIAGAWGVWLLTRRESFGFMLLGWTGFVIALFGGIVDVSDLSRSQVPFAFPVLLARLSIAVAIGSGAGFVIAAVKRSPRPEISPPDL